MSCGMELLVGCWNPDPNTELTGELVAFRNGPKIADLTFADPEIAYDLYRNGRFVVLGHRGRYQSQFVVKEAYRAYETYGCLYKTEKGLWVDDYQEHSDDPWRQIHLTGNAPSQAEKLKKPFVWMTYFWPPEAEAYQVIQIIQDQGLNRRYYVGLLRTDEDDKLVIRTEHGEYYIKGTDPSTTAALQKMEGRCVRVLGFERDTYEQIVMVEEIKVAFILRGTLKIWNNRYLLETDQGAVLLGLTYPIVRELLDYEFDEDNPLEMWVGKTIEVFGTFEGSWMWLTDWPDEKLGFNDAEPFFTTYDLRTARPEEAQPEDPLKINR